MSVVRTARNCISSAAPLVMLLRTFCFEVTNCLTLCIVQDLKWLNVFQCPLCSALLRERIDKKCYDWAWRWQFWHSWTRNLLSWTHRCPVQLYSCSVRCLFRRCYFSAYRYDKVCFSRDLCCRKQTLNCFFFTASITNFKTHSSPCHALAIVTNVPDVGNVVAEKPASLVNMVYPQRPSFKHHNAAFVSRWSAYHVTRKRTLVSDEVILSCGFRDFFAFWAYRVAANFIYEQW